MRRFRGETAAAVLTGRRTTVKKYHQPLPAAALPRRRIATEFSPVAVRPGLIGDPHKGNERMQMVKRITPAALILAAFFGLALVRADDAPKYTVKEVMDMAHKDSKDKTVLSIYSKLLATKDADEQKKLGAQLVDLYTIMGQNKAPKGDADDWTKRVNVVVAAAKDVADGKDGSVDALKKANDCRGCHMSHRVFKP